MNHNKTLFLILARSQSKGVPNKNIMELDNIPLIGLRAISIKNSGVVGDIVCSTDSEQYASIARKYGVDVPFLRPIELSGDDAKSTDVMLHALDWLERERGATYENLVLVEPSSPFCRPCDIVMGMGLLEKPGVTSVVSVRKTHPHSFFVSPMGENGELSELVAKLKTLPNLNRQKFKPEFTPSGLFYGTKVASFRETATFYVNATYGFEVDETYSVEIDSPLDADWARYLWDCGKIDKTLWAYAAMPQA